MKISGNTVLITGGTAGIGFELAKILASHDNEVIITGRNEDRLKSAVSELGNVNAFVSDVSNKDHVDELVEHLTSEFPRLNTIINNAGRAMMYNVIDEGINAFEKTQEEMLTNFLSVVRLNEKLLPLLRKQQASAIVNVTSVAAFLPGSLVGYAASKAALHSYTQSLRMALENNFNVKVFELMPPLVNTEFSKEIGGVYGISARQVAEEFLTGFENDNFEIRVGRAEQLYQLYLSSPGEAIKLLKSQIRAMKPA